MKTIGLHILGAFEDAFIYMGHMVALTRERSLRFYTLDALVHGSHFTSALPLLTYLFLRSDWLTSEAFLTLRSSSYIAKAIARDLDTLPSVIELPRLAQDASIEVERDLGLRNHLLLDLQIYNRRLYLAAGSGFYHIDPEWDSLKSWRQDMPTKRHDGRSICSTAGYGAVNVSCGDDGLFTAFAEFNWTARISAGSFDRTADRSQRAAWSGPDLMNYPTSTTPELLRSTSEQTTEGGIERERRVVTTLGASRYDLTDLLHDTVMENEGQTADVSSHLIQTIISSSIHKPDTCWSWGPRR